MLQTRTGKKTDAEIQQDVILELKWDPRVEETEVGVEVDNGIVTLTGDVPSLETSLRASEMARRVSGVRAVHNELTVENGKTHG